MSGTTRRASNSLFLLAIVLLILMGVLAFVFDVKSPAPPWWNVYAIWIAAIVLITAIVATIGRMKNGKVLGIAIDGRHKYSLSRLQMTFWTILVIATIYTFTLWNLGFSTAPMNFVVPPVLWALMGISSISLVGSPLILNNKPVSEVVKIASPVHAQWSDLIAGEENGNRETIDLARVQMLLITIIVGISYTILIAMELARAKASAAVIVAKLNAKNAPTAAKKIVTDAKDQVPPLDSEALAKVEETAKLMVKNADNILNELTKQAAALGAKAETVADAAISSFPEMSAGIIALLTISHAGYLTYKAVKK